MGSAVASGALDTSGRACPDRQVSLGRVSQGGVLRPIGVGAYSGRLLAPEPLPIRFLCRSRTRQARPWPAVPRYASLLATEEPSSPREPSHYCRAGRVPSSLDAVPLALAQARHRWAELLRRIFEVDPLRCPRCGDAMRIVAVITELAVIDRILDHLRRSASPARRARAPPRRRAAARTATSA
jgi:hypothetical protein